MPVAPRPSLESGLERQLERVPAWASVTAWALTVSLSGAAYSIGVAVSRAVETGTLGIEFDWLAGAARDWWFVPPFILTTMTWMLVEKVKKAASW